MRHLKALTLPSAPLIKRKPQHVIFSSGPSKDSLPQSLLDAVLDPWSPAACRYPAGWCKYTHRTITTTAMTIQSYSCNVMGHSLVGRALQNKGAGAEGSPLCALGGLLRSAPAGPCGQCPEPSGHSKHAPAATLPGQHQPKWVQGKSPETALQGQLWGEVGKNQLSFNMHFQSMTKYQHYGKDEDGLFLLLLPGLRDDFTADSSSNSQGGVRE